MGKLELIFPKGLDLEQKKRILLHACCAPCSSAIIEFLKKEHFEISVFFYNPNIYPLEEYIQRKHEIIRYLELIKVPFIDIDKNYSYADWLIEMRGYEKSPERGERCLRCFQYRMDRCAEYASQNGFNLFTSSLASSRWKNIEQIHFAGEQAAKKFPPTLYWAQNWRKGGLSERRNELLKENGFYNQQYCGCEFSMRG